MADEPTPPQGLSEGARAIAEKLKALQAGTQPIAKPAALTPPPPWSVPTGGGANPFWSSAAKAEGISPITGMPMLGPNGQPLPPWHFQQGPMSLPPVPPSLVGQ